MSRRIALSILLAATCALTAACGSAAPDITGVWQADDGTGIKTVNEDGSCTGMYYNNGEPLDIGGSMSCLLGDTETDGTYLLVVRQPPNERTYQVRFEGSDVAVLLDNAGQAVVTLTRQ